MVSTDMEEGSKDMFIKYTDRFITQVATLFFSMEKRTAQIQDLRERQGEYTLVTSEAQEVGSAAFIEEIWGSNLGVHSLIQKTTLSL